MAGFKRDSVCTTTLFNTYVFDGNSYVNKDRTRAFEISSKIKFATKIHTSSYDVKLLIKSDDGTIYKQFDLFIENDNYVVYIDLSKEFDNKTGLYQFKFVFTNENGDFELSEKDDGIGDVVRYRQSNENFLYNLFLYTERSVQPLWLQDGIIYQIFTDRFYKGREEPIREDAVMNDDWYNGTPEYKAKPGQRFKNNMFFGGDLYGIGDKMEYINSLGVKCIYLNPIFESFSNHKYDTGNYEKIDDMFGGEEGFKYLIEQANKYGIKVILDGVFNHTGDDSVYFNKNKRYDSIGAYNSKESKYYEWYTFYKYPDEYDSWWGFKSLPRVNCDNPSYNEFLFGENGVIKKYIRMGISGYRLDVVDEVTDRFLVNLKKAVCDEKPDAYVVGEVWENAVTKFSYGTRRRYLCGDEIDSVMNYPLRTGIIAYLRDDDYKALLSVYEHIYNEYPTYAKLFCFNTLGTHDTVRIITALAGKDISELTRDEQATTFMTDEEYLKGKQLLKFAYLLINMFPGIPALYYGDETGMQGYADPFCRRPYKWGMEDQELLDFFKSVGKIRKDNNEFESECFRIVYIDSDIICLERGLNTPIICIINKSNDGYRIHSNVKMKNIFTNEECIEHDIKPNSFILLKSKENPDDYNVYKINVLEENNI